MKVDFTLNGRPLHADVEPRMSLADLLRAPAQGCTSVHLGCEHGVCGACTVVMDGRIVRSCIALAASCEDSDIRTLEGLGDDALIGELRAAFHEHHGLQCGFCTPAMLITAREIIAQNAALDEDAIRVAMSGNICRCTGYTGIVAAIAAVAARHQPGGQ